MKSKEIYDKSIFDTDSKSGFQAKKSIIKGMIDLLIKNGMIFDGSGSPAYPGDIAIQNGQIIGIGNFPLSEAKHVIDAAGMAVTPGFIDIHRHADAAIFRPDFGKAELRQGLTTIINGNCGLSIAPFGNSHKEEILSNLFPVLGEVPSEIPTDDLEHYFRAAGDLSLPLHCGMLCGAGVILADTVGYDRAKLSQSAIKQIRTKIEKSLSDGAMGISLGLEYAPECFYGTEELISALEGLRSGDIPITVHMRQEGSDVLKSVHEMLHVAEELRCPIHISHLKAMGRKNRNNRIPEILRLLEEAREKGIQIDCDVYPYTAGSTQLMHILPSEFLTGGTEALAARLKSSAEREKLRIAIESGASDCIANLAGWDGIYLTSLSLPENQPYIGKSLARIGEMRGTSPLDACCDLLISEKCRITMIDFMASEADINRILQSPLSCLISDAIYPDKGLPHPRLYSAFTRFLETYVLKRGVLPMEEAIRKITSVPASVMRLKNKGTIMEGKDADICVFDPASLHENADYSNPKACSSGMRAVIVAGKIALENDHLTGDVAGKILRRE